VGGILQERNDEGGENHPAFKDLNYQKRRNQIAEISRNTKISEVRKLKFFAYLNQIQKSQYPF